MGVNREGLEDDTFGHPPLHPAAAGGEGGGSGDDIPILPNGCWWEYGHAIVGRPGYVQGYHLPCFLTGPRPVPASSGAVRGGALSFRAESAHVLAVAFVGSDDTPQAQDPPLDGWEPDNVDYKHKYEMFKYLNALSVSRSRAAPLSLFALAHPAVPAVETNSRPAVSVPVLK